MGAILIRNLINPEDQLRLYQEELYNPGVNSKEHETLNDKKSKKPWFYTAINAHPFAVWNNVFTNHSNITEPKELLVRLNQAIEMAKEFVSKNPPKDVLSADFQIPTNIHIDNLFAQLYPVNGKAISHVDGFLNWVASISFGDSCEFAFGSRDLSQKVRLNSGDVIIFNGGKVYHAVKEIYPNSAPEFWTSGAVKTFGLSRCNIQCRDSSSVDPNCPQNWKDMYKV